MTIERETLKLEKRLCRQVGEAIVQFNMIEAGDRVMVCMSGGKDSYGMLDILLKMQARAPVDFELIAVNLDQKQPGFPADVLPAYLDSMGVKFHIETQNPRRQNHVQLVQPLAQGHFVQSRQRTGLQQIGLGPPPRRHVANLFLEHVFWRQAQRHAAKVGERQR
jgi:tRNA(Ile)-lysidine synthase TilS/MesJ